MTFSELKIMSRALVVEATASTISNEVLELTLNESANKVAELLLCLPTDSYFDVVADQQEYDLSSVVDRYLVSENLYWYDGSNWKQLNPRTSEYLNKKYVYWRDDSSGDPLRFFIDNDNLVIHPTPDTSGTSYFRLYYFEGTQTMTSDSHYPFGHSSEIPRLKGASWSILLYWRMQALKILGKTEGNEFVIAEQEFEKEIQKQKIILDRVPYINKDNKARFKGQIV